MRKGRTFGGWSEGTLNFPPTYKYEFNSEKYYGEDPKIGRRTPAWCTIYLILLFLFFPMQVDLHHWWKCVKLIFFQVRSDSFIWEGTEAAELQEGRAEAIWSPASDRHLHCRGWGILHKEAPACPHLHRCRDREWGRSDSCRDWHRNLRLQGGWGE